MSAAGHTAGVWVAACAGVFVGEMRVATAAHSRDVEGTSSEAFPDYATSIANARLIAAAPDLLAALLGLLAHSGVSDVPDTDKFPEDIAAESAARAAISRATGAQS